MESIKNFLMILDANWISILVCIGIIVGIVQKTMNFFSKSEEEQVEIAKQQITAIMLKLITSAEIDFSDWSKSGEIKRSQVINEIYTLYPILSRVANQEEIIAFIDEQINASLKTLRVIVKENKEEAVASE